MGSDLVTGPVVRAPVRAAGAVLAAATRVVGALRRSARPLHPRGQWWTATLRRTGSPVATGVQWLDAQGDDEVVARFSTSVGLPRWCPDIQGVAMRIPVVTPDGAGRTDVLMASTGTGPVGRHVLRPARAGHGSPYTTLLPYRGPRGSVQLAMRRVGDGRVYEVAHSGVTGAWHVFATLTLEVEVPAPAGGDEVRFDPVLAPPPGLRHHDWVVWLREPAYVVARR